MGKRLTRIYTRTGDDGTTGLGSGERVPKESPRVEAYGTVDELNCALGCVLAGPDLPIDLAGELRRIQHELFDIGGELSIPGRVAVTPEHVSRLEQLLDRINANLPPLEDFVLPGGGRTAADIHTARAVCRRAERRTWALARSEKVNPECLRYLNRLSDLLFVLARELARGAGADEHIWQGGRLARKGPDNK